MDTHEWLDVVRCEYLGDFVRRGGAAVKFAVPADDVGRQRFRAGLRAAALADGYHFAFVDAETTRLHLIDKLFFEVARQVDWDSLARAYLERSLAQLGFRLPDTGEPLDARAIAALNGSPEPLFLADVRPVYNHLYRDYAMSREFRLAMIQLCRAQLDPAGEAQLADAVRQWLRGELRLISALKQALIFQKIARHNARHVLFSLAHWLTLAGRSGLVLGLDIARCADAARPSERGSGFYYSTAAVMDAYEMLRQLIDATDELTACFVGVAAPPAFLTDDKRGVRAYHALFLRIADDVRDRYRPNPRSALVRLDAAAAPPPQEAA